MALDTLRSYQKGRDLEYAQTAVRNPELPKRRKYVQIDIRLKTIVQDIENRSTIDYLKSIAHNINPHDAHGPTFSIIFMLPLSVCVVKIYFYVKNFSRPIYLNTIFFAPK